MTREEQIRQASIEYTYQKQPMCIGGGAFSEMVDEMNRNHAFEEGARWADETMIEKVCEWLKKNIDLYAYESLNTHYSEIKLTECFEIAFRQAMQENKE